MKFFDFLAKFHEHIAPPISDKADLVPLQYKGYVTWYEISLTLSNDFIISAQKSKNIRREHILGTSKIKQHILPNYKIVDKLRMKMYGAKIQEVYA